MASSRCSCIGCHKCMFFYPPPSPINQTCRITNKLGWVLGTFSAMQRPRSVPENNCVFRTGRAWASISPTSADLSVYVVDPRGVEKSSVTPQPTAKPRLRIVRYSVGSSRGRQEERYTDAVWDGIGPACGLECKSVRALDG